ncbi:hydrogenase maturation protease [Chloroflexota bacterium]
MNKKDDKTMLVLGIGNEIMGDEGFGVHVVRKLKEVNLPGYVRVEEGGVGGFNLLGQLEGIERLIVVDVMMMDSPPGELRLLKPGAELREPGKTILSFHQVGVLELVQMWGLLGHEPEIEYLVTRPEKIEWGTSLSPSLQGAVTRATKWLIELCLDNASIPERSKC